jgi:hypothetical protein
MARVKNHSIGLDEAMRDLARAQALLVQTQAKFVSDMAETNHRLDMRFSKIDERFGHIEATLAQHGQILNELIRILHALPEAVREKIGFKPPTPT